jgi:hypothetical protein
MIGIRKTTAGCCSAKLPGSSPRSKKATMVDVIAKR